MNAGKLGVYSIGTRSMEQGIQGYRAEEPGVGRTEARTYNIMKCRREQGWLLYSGLHGL